MTIKLEKDLIRCPHCKLFTLTMGGAYIKHPVIGNSKDCKGSGLPHIVKGFK